MHAMAVSFVFLYKLNGKVKQKAVQCVNITENGTFLSVNVVLSLGSFIFTSIDFNLTKNDFREVLRSWKQTVHAKLSVQMKKN